jgi:WD40 repeat protein
MLAPCPCGCGGSERLRGLLQVFDAVTAQLLPGCDFSGHCDMVYDMSWSPDGSTVASCSSDCTTKLWRVSACTHHFAQHPAEAGRDTVKLQEDEAHFCVTLAHAGFAYACQFCPECPVPQEGTSAEPACMLLAVGLEGGMIRFWSVIAHEDSICAADLLMQVQHRRDLRQSRVPAADAAVTALAWDCPGTCASPASAGAETSKEPHGRWHLLSGPQRCCTSLRGSTQRAMQP